MRSLAAALASVALLSPAPPAVQSTRVRIPVWADAGAALRAEDLSVKLDGKPAGVLRLQGPSDSLLLLLVVDLVEDLNEVDLARSALAALIDELPENVFVGLMRAQDGLRVLVDPTQDRATLADKIKTFPSSGTPGLLESIESATGLADAILAKAPVRIALWYVTDSIVQNYREDFTNPVINYSDHGDLSRRFPEGLVRERISKLEASLSARQTPVFIVHLERMTDRLNEAYQNGLMQLAAATGGASAFCRSNSDIGAVIQDMFGRIVSHYSVDVRVPPDAAQNAVITLESAAGNVSHRGRISLRRK